MARKVISLEIDKEAFDVLRKRAKKELRTLPELLADIIRRSVLSYKSKKSGKDNVDDKYLVYFSKQNKGRKPKRKKKKS